MDEIPVGSIRPGDLLLHFSKGEVSKLIQWVSDSDYSHVAMVYEVGSIKEAASGGVRRFSLNERIRDPEGEFFRIDVARPTGINPIPATMLDALRSSADAMDGTEFALNQMFQLGVIWALRNKTPPNTMAKQVLTWLFDAMIPSDPARLLCSEFVYLAYRNAITTPPGVLEPKIQVTKRAPRPFPSVDWFKLLDEFAAAKGASPAPTDVQPAVPAFEIIAGAADKIDDAYQTALLRARERIISARSKVHPGTEAAFGAANPDLVLPQDLADSHSFAVLGTAVP